MFEPIDQLQMLLRRALLTREVCRRWAAAGDDPAYGASALLAWRISRVVSGWLSGHPNQQYHPPSSARAPVTTICAGLRVRAGRWSRRARARWLNTQLKALARDCADIRAVTSSVSINEMLGRHQPSLAALQRFASARPIHAIAERGAANSAAAKRVTPPTPRYELETWPFLSI
jgi:hypothetical protein